MKNKSGFWLYERLNVEESKSSYCKLAKAAFSIITVYFKDCCNSVVLLSVPGRVMNTTTNMNTTCSIYNVSNMQISNYKGSSWYCYNDQMNCCWQKIVACYITVKLHIFPSESERFLLIVSEDN